MSLLTHQLCILNYWIDRYTKKSDDYKNFYAICRGVFPIHELCGTTTALLLAQRDVLGVHTPLWKILGPAVFIHGMANFRGMKPIFKWGSSTPWSEMQLYPWKVGSNFTLKQLLSTSYAKIVWVSRAIMGRTSILNCACLVVLITDVIFPVHYSTTSIWLLCQELLSNWKTGKETSDYILRQTVRIFCQAGDRCCIKTS